MTENTFFKEYKYNMIVLAIFGIALLAFTRDIKAFIGLFIGFIIVGYIPGMALSILFLKNWGNLERAIISLFIGLGVTPILAYFFSSIGIKAVSITFSIIIAVISGITIYYMQHRYKKHT